MHILIAPNAFKSSLDAASVAEAIEQGLKESALKCSCECFPIGDGGDGTAALLVEKFRGRIITTGVHDPLGKKIQASFGLIDKGNTAVIEMADASGLRLLKTEELDVLHATSFGTGELIKQALDQQVNKIILCIGGSASVDGGAGILRALGVRFLNAEGNDLVYMPASLVDLAVIDTALLDKRIKSCEFIVLCDVENVLLGSEGAATVFGPQKGAKEKDIEKLEAALTRLSEVSFNKTGINMALIQHGGAAGGVSAGLHVFLNAQLVNGIEYFLNLTNFDESLEKADLVITGEGSIDEQTLSGKGPFGVAKRAKEKNLPVIGLAGKVPLQPNAELQKYFDMLISINNEADIETAMKFTKENLVRTARMIGDLMALSKRNFRN